VETSLADKASPGVETSELPLRTRARRCGVRSTIDICAITNVPGVRKPAAPESGLRGG
jgi:hypothetical protein